MIDVIKENLSSFELYVRIMMQKKYVVPEKIFYGKNKEQYFLYYEPEEVKSDIVIFYVHGGGWNAGSPDFFDFVGQRCAKEGYRFVSCGYRLSPRFKYPCQIEDVNKCFKSSNEFLKGRNVNTNRLVVLGPSAGAHLGSILTYDYYFDNIIAFIGLGGLYSFDNSGLSVRMLLNMLFEKDYERKAAEPVNRIRKSGIKALLIQSRHDGVINFDCMLKMSKALKDKGNSVELYEVEDKQNTHSFYTAGCFMLDREKNKTIDKIFSFIEKL